jgi:hypothetical protein
LALTNATADNLTGLSACYPPASGNSWPYPRLSVSAQLLEVGGKGAAGIEHVRAHVARGGIAIAARHRAEDVIVLGPRVPWRSCIRRNPDMRARIASACSAINSLCIAA